MVGGYPTCLNFNFYQTMKKEHGTIETSIDPKDFFTEEGQRSPLYFAYGSNMSTRQMSERCPNARPVAPLTIYGYSLVFIKSRGRGTGVASIIPDPDGIVHGALYEMTPSDSRLMDAYEGFPTVYRKVSFDAKGEPAYFYEKVEGEQTPPAPDYFHRILRGYADWEHPREDAFAALQRSHKLPTEFQRRLLDTLRSRPPKNPYLTLEHLAAQLSTSTSAVGRAGKTLARQGYVFRHGTRLYLR